MRALLVALALAGCRTDGMRCHRDGARACWSSCEGDCFRVPAAWCGWTAGALACRPTRGECAATADDCARYTELPDATTKKAGPP